MINRKGNAYTRANEESDKGYSLSLMINRPSSSTATTTSIVVVVSTTTKNKNKCTSHPSNHHKPLLRPHAFIPQPMIPGRHLARRGAFLVIKTRKRGKFVQYLCSDEGGRKTRTGEGVDDVLQRKSERIKRKLQEKEVPSTSFARMVGFGGMAAKVAMQSMFSGKSSDGSSGGGDRKSDQAAAPGGWMSDAVADTIASELCRMRGAALKVGQILSLQDSQNLPKPLAKALERVRTEANIMPKWQLHQVMTSNLGPSWRGKFSEFNEEPVAAASIGQVHRGRTLEGSDIAIKVQYPGVAHGIDADMANLQRLLSLGSFVPKGLFLDRVIATAKEELKLECDYLREAENQSRFRTLLTESSGDNTTFSDAISVPRVHTDLTTSEILTSDWVEGDPVDSLTNDSGEWATQEVRDSVASRLLQLVIRELFDFRLVQSDPNWSNFLYDKSADILHLIDFGAVNEYPEEFVTNYLKLVKACADKDKAKILRLSKQIGFLNGKESPTMIQAHLEAAYIMGEPFANEEPFDFSKFKHGERMAEQGTVFLNERLVPPPKEVYTLHRKLFGAISTCVKLRAKVPCRKYLNAFLDS